MKDIFIKSNKPKLSRYEWYEKVSKYLNIPPEEVLRALGEKSGFTQDDKVAFAIKYNMTEEKE